MSIERKTSGRIRQSAETSLRSGWAWNWKNKSGTASRPSCYRRTEAHYLPRVASDGNDDDVCDSGGCGGDDVDPSQVGQMSESWLMDDHLKFSLSIPLNPVLLVRLSVTENATRKNNQINRFVNNWVLVISFCCSFKI